jgi:peroxiredoxin
MPTILQPGIQAPQFELPAANLQGQASMDTYQGKKLVLIFFPSRAESGVVDQLSEYQKRVSDFKEQGAFVVGVSNASREDLRQLAEEKDIEFPLGSDTRPNGATAAHYRVRSEVGEVLPSVFVIDEEGLIRRAYESTQYPRLPKPAAVARALKKLDSVPKPVPITKDDWCLGPLDAPVTVIEYADYECKPCGEAYRLLKHILPQYGDKVLWVHRHLPLRHSHPLAQKAAEAAEAAGAQAKFWEMHDRLFAAQGVLDRDRLIKYAHEICLDVERFTRDLDSNRFREAVNQDFKQAVRNKIKLPPALFINLLPLEGAHTEGVICARIDGLLACIS